VRHQIEFTGEFTSGGLIQRKDTNLIFIPNPDFKSDITPFQLNLMHKYSVEYNFELSREKDLKSYLRRFIQRYSSKMSKFLVTVGILVFNQDNNSKEINANYNSLRKKYCP